MNYHSNEHHNLAKYSLYIAIATLIFGIIAVVINSFDLLNLGNAKSVTIVNKPTVKIDETQLNMIVGRTNNSLPQNLPQSNSNITRSESPMTPQQRIILNNLDTKAIDNVNASISVAFNNVMGKTLAKLTIAPAGKDPVILPIFNSGQSIKFNSSTGSHIASVLSVNFSDNIVVVSVSNFR